MLSIILLEWLEFFDAKRLIVLHWICVFMRSVGHKRLRVCDLCEIPVYKKRDGTLRLCNKCAGKSESLIWLINVENEDYGTFLDLFGRRVRVCDWCYVPIYPKRFYVLNLCKGCWDSYSRLNRLVDVGDDEWDFLVKCSGFH